jgi:predicted nucleic acid-binding Zn finger protein
MEILKIKRSTQKTGLKIYGTVRGESGKEYKFAYFRRPNFRGWICSCESFFFDMFKKSRNCKHLRFVRNEVGRFGSKVPKAN